MRKSRRSFLQSLSAVPMVSLAGCYEAKEDIFGSGGSVPAPVIGDSGEVNQQSTLEAQTVETFLSASSLAELVQPNQSPAVALTHDRGWRRWDPGAEVWVIPPTVVENFTESALPAADVPGRIVWNADRTVITFSDGEDWEVPVVGDDVKTGTTEVVNTTSEELIWDGNIDAGSMKVGRVYEIHLHGIFSNASTSDLVTINFYIGGSQIGSVESSAQSATDEPWSVMLTMTVVSEGESGTVRAHVDAAFDQNKADDNLGGVSGIDTTASDIIEIKAVWNNAKAGNSLVREQGYMKEIG